MRILVAVVVVLLASDCHAQRLLSGGSQSQRQAQMERDAQWRAAKKLFISAVPAEIVQPTTPASDPDMLEDKQVGDLAFWQFSVVNVIDPKNALLRLGDNTYWLADFPTKALADGQAVHLIGPVLCIGTKQYTSVLGASKTVKAFRFVTQEEIAKQEKEKADAEEARFWGTWHSKAGTEVVAKFVEWKGGKVKLLTKDNRTLLVDIDAFTKADADALRELNRELRAKK